MKKKKHKIEIEIEIEKLKGKRQQSKHFETHNHSLCPKLTLHLTDVHNTQLLDLGNNTQFLHLVLPFRNLALVSVTPPFQFQDNPPWQLHMLHSTCLDHRNTLFLYFPVRSSAAEVVALAHDMTLLGYRLAEG